MARKRPNRIPDTGAADKEHKYESATNLNVGSEDTQKRGYWQAPDKTWFCTPARFSSS
jgi:hypothetical protein